MPIPLGASYCNASHGADPDCFYENKFQPNASTSWSSTGSTNALSAVGLSNLAVDKGTTQPYGLMNVGLGKSGVTSLVLTDGMVAGMDSKDFSTALFALSNMEVNFGGLSTKATLISKFASESVISSLSFSYTAGSYDRTNATAGMPPSLVLGGYDASRFDASTIMRVNITKAVSLSNPYQFAVNVASITLHSKDGIDTSDDTYVPSDTPLSDSTLAVYVDSVTPYLWLPLSACEVFEKVFRLTWNETAQLYLINSTSRDWLLRHPKSVTFSFSSTQTTPSGSGIKNFTLSSSALDLRVAWPLVETEGYYFPLKRSSGTNMLGRAFLQETHISVDYERGYFNLSQSTPWTNQTEDLVTIVNTTWDKAVDPGPSGDFVGISAGAYAGIVLGVTVAVIALALILSWRKKWWPFRSRQKGQEGPDRHDYEKAELHGAAVPWVEAMGQERAELQTQEQRHEVAGLGGVQAELPESHTLYELDANEMRREMENLAVDHQQ